MPGRSLKRKQKSKTRKTQPQEQPTVSRQLDLPAESLTHVASPDPSCEAFQPFPLLDLPVECVTRVLSHVDNLTDRTSLQRAVDTDEFHDGVVCNPKAWRFPIEIIVKPSFKPSPKVRLRVKYADMVVRASELELFAYAKMCPSRVELTIDLRHKIGHLCKLWAMHCDLSFVGTRVVLTIRDDGITNPKTVHRQVTNLLSPGLRSRLRSVCLLLNNERNQDLDRVDRFSSQRRLLPTLTPTELLFVQRVRSSAVWPDVPTCLKAANASTLDNLVKLHFLNQPLCSHVLVTLLGKLPNLKDLWCLVIHLPGTNVPHWSFDRLRRLTIHPVGFPDEDGDLCDISDDGCDFYRRLLVACRMAHAVTFLFDNDFTIGFFNTIVHTFIATRQCREPEPKLGFEAPHGWLRRSIYRRVRLRAPLHFTIHSDADGGTLYVIRSQQPGAGDLIDYLPDAIRPIFAVVGGEIEKVFAADLRAPLPGMDLAWLSDMHSAQFSVRVRGWPQQLFSISMKQRMFVV